MTPADGSTFTTDDSFTVSARIEENSNFVAVRWELQGGETTLTRCSNNVCDQDFNAGLDRTIGAPHPQLREQMQREHCSPDLPDTRVPFASSSYEITTSSVTEWWFVVDSAWGIQELGERAQEPAA